jgi:hypothetical protein
LRPERGRAKRVEAAPDAADGPATKGVTINRLYRPVDDLDLRLKRIFALLTSAPEGSEAQTEAGE